MTISLQQIALLIFLSLILPSVVIAQNDPDTTDQRGQIIRRIRERFDVDRFWGHVDISVNPAGFVTDLRGHGINTGLTATDPVARARQFFDLNGDIMGVNRQEIVLRGSIINPNGSGIVDFDQDINGIKVFMGGYRISFVRDTSGCQIDEVSGWYYPEARDINTTPSIDSLGAFEIALSDPQNDKPYVLADHATLIIANFQDGLHLTWDFFVSFGGYYDGEAEYFMDAHSGEVLKIAPGARY